MPHGSSQELQQAAIRLLDLAQLLERKRATDALREARAYATGNDGDLAADIRLVLEAMEGANND